MLWNTTRSSLIAHLRNPRNESAWRRFDRLYGDVIVRYAKRRGLSLDDAEDIRQIVLLSLVRAMPTFQLDHEKGKFRSYLGKVVGNAIHRYRTKPYRLQEEPEEDLTVFEVTQDDSELDALWAREWTDHHLRQAMETLQQTTQTNSLETFSRLLRGESPESIARATGSTIDAVYKVQQRVRSRLRRLVREQIQQEESFLGGLTNGTSA